MTRAVKALHRTQGPGQVNHRQANGGQGVCSCGVGSCGVGKVQPLVVGEAEFCKKQGSSVGCSGRGTAGLGCLPVGSSGDIVLQVPSAFAQDGIEWYQFESCTRRRSAACSGSARTQTYRAVRGAHF